MSRENFRYVSPEYVSNCLIEAVKAKLKDPRRVKLYFCKPTFAPDYQMFHFMWSDGKADYDFSDCGHGKTPWYRCLLFKGQIRQFKPGFAARYSSMRNKGASVCG